MGPNTALEPSQSLCYCGKWEPSTRPATKGKCSELGPSPPSFPASFQRDWRRYPEEARGPKSEPGKQPASSSPPGTLLHLVMGWATMPLCSRPPQSLPQPTLQRRDCGGGGSCSWQGTFAPLSGGGNAGSLPWTPQAFTSCLTFFICKVALKTHQSSLPLPERNAKRTKIKWEVNSRDSPTSVRQWDSGLSYSTRRFIFWGRALRSNSPCVQWGGASITPGKSSIPGNTWQSTVLEGREGGEQRGCTCRGCVPDHPLRSLTAPVCWRPVQGAAPSLNGRLAETEAPPSAVPRAERGLVPSGPEWSAFSKGTEYISLGPKRGPNRVHLLP